MKIFIYIFFSCYACSIKAQVITTFAGNGMMSNTGDGGAATAASIARPGVCTFDKFGNFYFANSDNVIRKIIPSGIISTVAGTGTGGYNGDGIAATTAKLNSPSGIAFDTLNNLYIADAENQRVRKIDAVTGVITTIAGTGIAGYGGDGGPATLAIFQGVQNICFDRFGNLYVLDYGNARVRKINTSGIINTVAGIGIGGDSGDGGMATVANIEDMVGICTDVEGNFYFSESGLRIRKVTLVTGIITEFAGIDSEGSLATGDGGSASAAAIDPLYISFDRIGNLFISGYIYNDIRMIDNSGIIHTVAGNGTTGFSGDNGPATAAEINTPYGIALDTCDNLYISDWANYRIRKVSFNPECLNLSANDIKNDENITIYPNPVYELLNIDNVKSETEYYLYSVVGTVVRQGELKEGDNSINIEQLPVGMYVLMMVDEEGNETVKKIVKQ